jgi:hypothetical protein
MARLDESRYQEERDCYQRKKMAIYDVPFGYSVKIKQPKVYHRHTRTSLLFFRTLKGQHTPRYGTDILWAQALYPPCCSCAQIGVSHRLDRPTLSSAAEAWIRTARGWDHQTHAGSLLYLSQSGRVLHGSMDPVGKMMVR